jgi:predicted cupin superfamily sugar epimerase
MTSQDLIRILQLQPHPEGGYYKETYRSRESVDTANGSRNVSTAIYYLLQDEDRSNFHRIKSDELWFFHFGTALEFLYIKERKLETVTLGSDVAHGEALQAVIPAGTWFAARVKNKKGFALVSCTVAPGFDFTDFELANREELTGEYPQLREVIEEYTK